MRKMEFAGECCKCGSLKYKYHEDYAECAFCGAKYNYVEDSPDISVSVSTGYGKRIDAKENEPKSNFIDSLRSIGVETKEDKLKNRTKEEISSFCKEFARRIRYRLQDEAEKGNKSYSCYLSGKFNWSDGVPENCKSDGCYEFDFHEIKWINMALEGMKNIDNETIYILKEVKDCFYSYACWFNMQYNAEEGKISPWLYKEEYIMYGILVYDKSIMNMYMERMKEELVELGFSSPIVEFKSINYYTYTSQEAAKGFINRIVGRRYCRDVEKRGTVIYIELNW